MHSGPVPIGLLTFDNMSGSASLTSSLKRGTLPRTNLWMMWPVYLTQRMIIVDKFEIMFVKRCEPNQQKREWT